MGINGSVRTSGTLQGKVKSLFKASEADALLEEIKAHFSEEFDKADRAIAEIKAGLEAGGYIESLKEANKGLKFTTWIGTEEEYKAIPDEEKTENCAYFTDTEPDYVIESGTTAAVKREESHGDITWTWRKWESGLAECFGNSETQEIEVNKAYGTGYYGEKIYFCFPEGLFENKPTVNVDFNSNNYGLPLVSICDLGKGGVTCGLYDSYEITRTGFFTIAARGRWKAPETTTDTEE